MYHAEIVLQWYIAYLVHNDWLVLILLYVQNVINLKNLNIVFLISYYFTIFGNYHIDPKCNEQIRTKKQSCWIIPVVCLVQHHKQLIHRQRGLEANLILGHNWFNPWNPGLISSTVEKPWHPFWEGLFLKGQVDDIHKRGLNARMRYH